MIYKFTPLLKQTLWGGDRIIPFKKLDAQMENVGESWEISGVEGHETVVCGGPDNGKTLNSWCASRRAHWWARRTTSASATSSPCS